MGKRSTDIFLDASLGTLNVIVFSHPQKGRIIHSYNLSKSTPLSQIIPNIWESMSDPIGVQEFLEGLNTIYVLQGPGMLTSLRVLFAHLMGLITADDNIKVKGCPTPVWYNLVLQNCKHKSSNTSAVDLLTATCLDCSLAALFLIR